MGYKVIETVFFATRNRVVARNMSFDEAQELADSENIVADEYTNYMVCKDIVECTDQRTKLPTFTSQPLNINTQNPNCVHVNKHCIIFNQYNKLTTVTGHCYTKFMQVSSRYTVIFRL